MKKHIIYTFIVILIFQFSKAQNNITFYRYSQAQIEIFHDVQIINGGEKYYLIGEKNFGLSIDYHTFILGEYDSSGTLVETSDMSYVYNNNNFYHDGWGGATYFNSGELFLRYGIKNPPPTTLHEILLDSQKNIIWKDKIAIVKKINHNSFIGVKHCDEDSCALYKTDYLGNINWELPYDIIFKTKTTNSKIFVIDSFISVIGFAGRQNYIEQFNESVVSLSGEILRQDSFFIRQDSLDIWDIQKTRKGYLLAGGYNDGVFNNWRMEVLDTSRNLLWDKKFTENYLITSSAYDIDSFDNYHVLLTHSKDKTSKNAKFEYYKISPLGKILKHQFISFGDTKLYIHKLKVLSGGGYFMLGGVSISENPIEYTAVFIKTDSNFNINKINSIDQPGWNPGNVNVFPNPLTTTTSFTLPTLPGQKAEFRLYNITGKLMKQEAFTGNSFQLKRGNLPTGMYLYHISAGEKVFVGKVLVE